MVGKGCVREGNREGGGVREGIEGDVKGCNKGKVGEERGVYCGNEEPGVRKRRG